MEGNVNTHWRTVMSTKYLSGDELPDDGLTVQIIGYDEETFFSPKTKKEEAHIVLKFKELKKPMIMTNRKAKQIEKALDTAMMSEWSGRYVNLVAVTEKHFGEFFKVVNVKTAKPKVLPELSPESNNWDTACEAIKEGRTDVSVIREHYKLSNINEKKLIAYGEKK